MIAPRWGAVAALVCWSALLAAQQQPGTRVGAQNDVLLDDAVRKLQGKTVRELRVVQASGPGEPVPLVDAAAAPILRSLLTRVGQPFEARRITNDCVTLWEERRIIATGYALEVDAGLRITFVLEHEALIYDSVDFHGLNKLDKTTVQDLLGVDSKRQVTRVEAKAMVKTLLARYGRDGFPFASVTLEEVDQGAAVSAQSIPGSRAPQRLVFHVDEGQRVTVRNIELVGNRAFPGTADLGVFGAGTFLLRDAGLKGGPAWGLINGGYYSREIVEEDIERLRLFYRGRGFLDATVDVADVLFSADRTKVDLRVVIVEGPRYKIRSVKLEHVDALGEVLTTPSRYSAQEIAAELSVQPGENYDFRRLQRDWLKIQEFYGKRGHPQASFPGMAEVPLPCRILWPPREVYGDGNVVDVTFAIIEGEPKKLQDVVIRGNRFTRDAVIRRRIRVEPGQRIDMTQVQRSIRLLNQTRYFLDPETQRGPRVQLEPAAGAEGNPELVDLGIDVQDAPTGELRWGVGISTGQGATGQLIFNKRNFDLWNPPSSPNPVDAVREVLDNEALHGGGQTLNFLAAPGSRYSQFRLTWTEPDIFNEHYDTHELRVSGDRLIRRLRDGYISDALSAELGLSRYFSDEFSVGLSLRESSISIEDLVADATAVAYDAEGRTEMRSARISARYVDYDDFRQPSEGVEVSLSAESFGDWLGGEEDLLKYDHTLHWYTPLWENEVGQRTVFHFEHRFGLGHAHGKSNDVFVTERYYMGGANLRGFDFRGAGPMQFGRPYGGEVMYTATAEVYFPLVSMRMDGEGRERELLRGLVFTDIGLLGLGVHDPSFHELRGSSGFGIRIEVPMFELPISLDVAWPWAHEGTDERQQLYFSIAR